MRGEFLDQFLKIQRDISLALCTSGDAKDDLISHCVHRLKALYYSMVVQPDHSGTSYQLALICLEIVWWGDPDLHDNLEAFAQEVFDLCEEMREDAAADSAATSTKAKKTKGKGKGKAIAKAKANTKEKSKEGYSEAFLEEVLQHLEALTQEALSYLREQTDRLRRRPQARKWLDYIRVEALSPHVPPMSGRVEDEPKQLAKRGVKFVVFRDDDEEEDGGGGDGGGEMDIDNDNVEEGAGEVDQQEHHLPSASVSTSSAARKRPRRIIKSNKQPRYYPNYPFDSNSNSTSADTRSIIYKRAFARYWNQDPTAWCAMIDRWEEEHGLEGCSRGLVEELLVGEVAKEEAKGEV